MSQKSDIETLLEAGKGYDEIEDSTGSTRTYIRSIAVQYRKRDTEDEVPDEPPKRSKEEKKPEENPSMNFVDDETPVEKSKDKSGADHHKEWVKAAKYECGQCGATIGKTTTFCPHCGKSLNWEGVE